MSIQAFATASDLISRWRDLSLAEQSRADVLLMDATAFLTSELNRCGVTINVDPESTAYDELQAANLKVVCCSIVKRAIANNTDGDYKQMSTTAGSFNEQFTFNNPSGDMYLTSTERNILNIPKRRLRIGSVQPETRFDREVL